MRNIILLFLCSTKLDQNGHLSVELGAYSFSCKSEIMKFEIWIFLRYSTSKAKEHLFDHSNPLTLRIYSLLLGLNEDCLKYKLWQGSRRENIAFWFLMQPQHDWNGTGILSVQILNNACGYFHVCSIKGARWKSLFPMIQLTNEPIA